MEKKKVSEEEIRLKQFGKANKCDAVLLNNGSIEKYNGQRWNVQMLYKLNANKVYDWRFKS